MSTARRSWTPRRLVVGATVLMTMLVGAVACGDDDVPLEATTTRAGAPNGTGPVHEFTVLDAGGPLTKQALAGGEIDVGILFTASAGEAVHRWVELVDDRGLQPVQSFVPAVHEASLEPDMEQVLNIASASLSDERVQAMIDRFLTEEATVAEVARTFVAGLGALPPVSGQYTVGRAGFAESELAAEIYAVALESAGASVTRTPELGFREVYFPTVESGDVDVMPEFVGALLIHLGGHPTDELQPTLEDLRRRAADRGVAILEPAPAESRDGLYVTAVTADQYDLETISDLNAVSVPLVFGGPAECPQRKLCLVGLEEVYGLRFER